MGEVAGTGQAGPVVAGAAWWRRRGVLLAAGAALAAAGVALGVATTSSGPGRIHVRGTLTLGFLAAGPADPDRPAADGEACTAYSGYSDIAAGAPVTVGGDKGQTLGVGALSSGVEAGVDDSLGRPLGSCVFSFDVPVDAGQDAYTVTIGHRGAQTFTPAQVQAPIALALSVS